MLKRLLIAAAAATTVLLTGCATRTTQAFENESDRVTATSDPVYLLTATVRNEYKKNWQPHLLVVNVEKEGATDASGRFNFTMDKKAVLDEGDKEAGNKYLLRMQLAPGKYEIVGLTELNRSFPIVATFFTPLHETLVVSGKGTITYLGHVEAKLRERKGEEFKAGPSIPLIDQAVAGASGGTWDVAIVDAWDNDEPVFRGKFAALKDAPVQKGLLAAWDRDAAQKWWAAH
jgi:hypothetical protein